MSFTRNNIFYQSLPINNSSSKYNNGSTMTSANLNPKTVNFNMQQQQQQQQQLLQETVSDLSSSSSSSKLQPTSAINTEEFAKLDALLEDLLAEVDQPILLSKETTISNKYASTNGGGGGGWSSATTGQSFNGGQHLEDFEKSVNWLNEQKEILRSRREAAAANKYHSMGSSSTSRLMSNGTADVSNQNDENLLNTSLNNQPYRKIKSKLDYYITNSNDGASNATNGRNNNNNNNNNNGNKYSFTYTSSSNSDNLKATNFNNENNFNDITASLNGIATNTNNNDLIDDANTLGGNLRQIPIVNNKPPVSPNTRNLYSPTQQQQQQQQQPQSTLISSSFRSLSNNPTALLKNINETDDENLIDSEFDRYSQKSYKSTASTIQRSKYHTVSNDYTECTRPSAPTPVPTYNTNRSFYQSKRALSAPPTEIGKIVLQRMELKSPLTVRQTSVVPFESAQNFVQANNDAQMTMNQAQAQPNVTYTTLANRSFIDNPYNNRGVLKTNYNITNQPALVGQQQPQQQQQLPVRNVYLNRSYSETPRVGYTNGYETDSGLVSGPNNYRMNSTNGTIGGYNTTARAYNGSYGGNQLNDSDIETSRGSTINYRSGNTGVMANSYRTIGPTSRYQLINDQTGYDTDTGLIKLRQVLDSRRASSSRNNVPLQGAPVAATSSSGYLYPNRCITPSFASYTSYNGAGSQQPIRVISQYNSQTNIPLNDHQRYGGAGSQEQMGSQYLVNAYPTSYIDQAGNTVSYLEENVQFMPTTTVQQISSIEYIDANGNITTGVPAFVSPDGRQIILKDIDPISGFGEAIVTPPTQQVPLQMQSPQQQQQQTQSMIIQHQVAPSSYNQSNIVRTNSQQRVETPNRIGGIVSSNSNLSTITNTTINQKQDQQQQQQQQQQQMQQQQQQQQSSQMTREDSKRGLSTSLTESNEVIRVHPKQVKSNLNFWYKPTISREEAIRLLKDKPPGTFLIRDSNNFPGAYGLALKVEKPPPNIQIKPGTDPSNELVRHFLIEPTSKGVRIKGCCNEPVFGSLAALVYQHSLTSLALPLKLLLPTEDLIPTGSNVTSPTNAAPANSNLNTNENINNNNTNTNKSAASSTASNAKQPTAQAQTIQDGRQLLEKGAACNVYYLNTVNIENKNGLDGISNALSATKAFVEKNSSALLLIQFKVTSQGITITDLNKKKFIKKHFPTNSIIYCAVDEKFTWPNKLDKIGKPRIFGVICKPEVTKGSNECHLFVELDPEQPAIAIVDFINRYLIPSKLSLKS